MKARAETLKITVITFELDISADDPRWSIALPDYAYLSQKALHALFDAVEQYSGAYEISLLLSNDHEIRKLNHEYRGQDKATNVLSFPQIDWSKAPDLHLAALGDIVISLETIQREAVEQKKGLPDHFMHMIVHGCLHLLGFDHEEEVEANAMENLEIAILRELGVNNPYNSAETMR